MTVTRMRSDQLLIVAAGGWLMLGGYLFLIGLAAATLVGPAVLYWVAPWSLGAFLIGSWLLLRSHSKRAAIVSVLGSLASAAVAVWTLAASTADFDASITILIVWSLALFVLSIAGWLRAMRVMNHGVDR